MAGILGSLADLAEKEAGEALAFGLGFALARALEPAGVELAQEAWKVAPIRAPDAGMAAAAAARGKIDHDKAAGWALEHGYSGDAFAAMVAASIGAPELGQAFSLWRRGEIQADKFREALERAGLEASWFDHLEALKQALLEPAALATAIHRGIVAGQGLLIREPPLGEGKIPHVPQSTLDAVQEAAGWGVDAERLRILVGNTGLPLSLGEMLQLLNRGEVLEDDVRRSVAQSNVRNEYMDVALALRRQLPTARDYLENALRGYRTLEEAIAGAALHGMEAADATMIYQNQGRPMAVRQITQALARGGTFKPEPGEITDPYEASIVEGNLKPAYYDLAKALRYALPSPSVIRLLATSDELTQAETEQLLLETGWKPDLAAKVAARWAGSAAGHGKAETLAELADDYAGGYMTEAEFRADLETLGYTGHTQDLVVHLNDARRVKRYREKVVDALAKAYEKGTITRPFVADELEQAGVSGQAQDELLGYFDLLARIANATPATVAP